MQWRGESRNAFLWLFGLVKGVGIKWEFGVKDMGRREVRLQCEYIGKS